MKKILSFESFTEQNTRVEETETSVEIAPEVNEAASIQALAKEAKSKDDFKSKILAQLKKTATTLAADDKFINTLVKTYDASSDEESVDEK